MLSQFFIVAERVFSQRAALARKNVATAEFLCVKCSKNP